MKRPGRSPAGWALPLILGASVSLAWGTTTEGAAPDAARLGIRLREVLLGRPDQVIICPGCPTEPALRVDVATGLSTEVPLPYQQLSQVTEFPDGKRILAATVSEKGKRSLLLVLSAESLAPLGRVEIPGSGERLAIAPDGYSAYLLCRRPGRGPQDDPDGGRWELVVVDLGASSVRETYPLSGAARDLALTPDGTRLFVAFQDRIQSFTTGPLTASWYYRSPGDNRRLSIRPRPVQVFALRGAAVAIFQPRPDPPSGESPADRSDDAAWVLDPPSRVERIGFSHDGRLAVAAGVGIDAMLLLDVEKRRFTGTWPEETAAINLFLNSLAAAERPRGPRGRLTGPSGGFTPPLQSPPGPAPPARSGAVLEIPGGVVTGTEGSAAGMPGHQGDATAPSPTAPKAAEGESPAPPPTRSPAAPSVPPQQGSPSGEAIETPTPAGSGPETSSLVEVAEKELSGKISGESGLVASVILFGPDSLTTVRDLVKPSADGTYTFPLPPKGRYRLVLVGAPGTALSCRPPFQTIAVGEYGFRGLDFRVLGIAGGAPKP